MERFTTGTGQNILVHDFEQCDSARKGAPQGCCVHGPSKHHMVDWPTHWRDDRKLMERICPHGIGHPDPDDIAFKRRHYGDEVAHTEAVHGCDGCCARFVGDSDHEKDDRIL